MKKDKSFCSGCRDNFYNGQGASECWSYRSAKTATRYRINWWTAPTEPGAFTKVKTFTCHKAPGKYAHYDELPSFAINPRNMKENSVSK